MRDYRAARGNQSLQELAGPFRDTGKAIHELAGRRAGETNYTRMKRLVRESLGLAENIASMKRQRREFVESIPSLPVSAQAAAGRIADKMSRVYADLQRDMQVLEDHQRNELEATQSKDTDVA